VPNAICVSLQCLQRLQRVCQGCHDVKCRFPDTANVRLAKERTYTCQQHQNIERIGLKKDLVHCHCCDCYSMGADDKHQLQYSKLLLVASCHPAPLSHSKDEDNRPTFHAHQQ
jgi:hypothetical protein